MALLGDFGIAPITVENPSNYSGDPEAEDPNEVLLVADQGGAEGYNGFHCRFAFTDDGSFKSVGIWE